MSQPNDFFIGYAPKQPAAYAVRVVFVLALLAVVVPAIAVLAALSQGPVDEGTFEFGVQRDFEGVIVDYPVPMLRMEQDGATKASLLVAFGKFGLPPWAREHIGDRVAFRGSLIYRRGMTMIEMNDEASLRVVEEQAVDATAPQMGAIGPVVLQGEIVDTKCFLGVMRPAVGKVHRACAIVCLAGGIPAGFLVRYGDGTESVFLLAAEPGKALDFDLQLAGTPVEISGEASMIDGMPVLRVASLRRL